MADFDLGRPEIEEGAGRLPDNTLADQDVEKIIDEYTPPVQPGTSTGFDTGVPTTDFTQRDRVTRSAVDDFYKQWERKGIYPNLPRDYNSFEYVNGTLRLKEYPDLDIINSKTGEPLALSTIARKAGGAHAIRYELGFPDWRSQGGKTEPEIDNPEITPDQVSALTKTVNELGDADKKLSDETEMKIVASGADDAVTSAGDAVSIVEELETELGGGTAETKFTLRELRGLDKALQGIRGELVSNLSKLTELKDHIAYEYQKLETEGISEDSKKRILKFISDLEEERDARLDAISINRADLRTQVNRIRETIRQVLYKDTTLAERIRTLFREQGITIVSILTAISMTISTLVLALTGFGGGGSTQPPAPPKPGDKGGVKEWVKKTLQSLGRVLAKLAGKAAAALPGIIGSIVSWVLTLLSKTAGWLAQNLWAVVVAIGGLLLMAAREFLMEKPKRD